MTNPCDFEPDPAQSGTNATSCAPTLTTLGDTRVGALKEAQNEALSQAAPRGHDRTAFRVVFSIHYTDLGLERLYEELQALTTEIARTLHIKRIFHGIVRGDFKRPSLPRSELAEHDRESFRIRLRFSSRDVGLEQLFDELLPMPTMFKRKSALRRKLYDAFNPGAASAVNAAATVVPPTQPASATTFAGQGHGETSFNTQPTQLTPLAAPVPNQLVNHDDISQRRRAARQASAGQFEKL